MRPTISASQYCKWCEQGQNNNSGDYLFDSRIHAHDGLPQHHLIAQSHTEKLKRHTRCSIASLFVNYPDNRSGAGFTHLDVRAIEVISQLLQLMCSTHRHRLSLLLLSWSECSLFPCFYACQVMPTSLPLMIVKIRTHLHFILTRLVYQIEYHQWVCIFVCHSQYSRTDSRITTPFSSQW